MSSASTTSPTRTYSGATFRPACRMARARCIAPTGDGEVDVGKCRAGKRVGVGVRWSADRARAVRLLDGEEQALISLAETTQWLQTLGMEAPSVLQKPARIKDTMDVLRNRDEDIVHYSFFTS